MYYAGHHHVRRHYAHHQYRQRHYVYRQYQHMAGLSRWDAGVAQMKVRGLADANASLPSGTFSGGAGM